MKFEILQEELVAGLITALRAVSPRVQLPILSYIKMGATKMGVTLTSTDLEIGITLVVPAKVEREGEVAVPGKMITEFLGTLTPGKLKVELKKDKLVIEGSGSRAEFLVLEATDFPQLPSFGSTLMKIGANEIEKAINGVVFASARDSLRPALTGVLFEVGKKLTMVATDGFRLAFDSVLAKEVEGETPVMLIPSRAVTELTKIINEGEIEVGYLEKSKQILFRQKQTLFISQLIDGNFPDYQRILPKEFVAELVVSREELLAAVKTAHVFARENSNMMRWIVGEGKIKITSLSPSKGECLVEVSAKVEGEEVEVVFNAKYVMDYLLIKTSENLWIGLGGKMAPGMIRESERKDGFYVVMPINV